VGGGGGTTDTKGVIKVGTEFVKIGCFFKVLSFSTKWTFGVKV